MSRCGETRRPLPAPSPGDGATRASALDGLKRPARPCVVLTSSSPAPLFSASNCPPKRCARAHAATPAAGRQDRPTCHTRRCVRGSRRCPPDMDVRQRSTPRSGARSARPRRETAAALEKAGYARLADPVGFTVAGEFGPLRKGELERARRWGSGAGRGHGVRETYARIRDLMQDDLAARAAPW